MKNNGKNHIPFLFYPIMAICIAFMVLILVGEHRDKTALTEEPESSAAIADGTGEISLNGAVVEYPYKNATGDEIQEGNPAERDTSGMYVNGIVISCTTRSGGTFSLGAENADTTDLLILNPSYLPVNDELIPWIERTQFAFYIQVDYGEIIFPECKEGTYNSAENAQYNSLYIQNRYYNTCLPACYEDNIRYGVGWEDINAAYGSDQIREVHLQIRIIRIYDGQLIDIIHATITSCQNSGEYSLSEIVRGDVSETSELTAAQRSRLIQMAKEYIVAGNEEQTFQFATNDWESAVENAFVEKTFKLYFPRLFAKNGSVVSSGKYVNCDLYAVNLPYSGTGFITVYLAPKLMLQGFDIAYAPGSTAEDTEFGILGYDPLYPQSEDTIAIPAYDKEYF